MKNTYFTLPALAILLLAAVYYGIPSQAAAATTGNYVWGGYQFSSFDALVDYLRVLYGEDRNTGTGNRTYTDSEVDVSTLSASKIGTTQATLRGVVDMNRSDYAHVWFEYGKNNANLVYDTATGYANDNGKTPFSGTVTNLERYTRYYYRAMAEDDDGDIANGKILSFTTGTKSSYDDDDDYYDDDDDNDGDEPDVTTGSVKSIDEDSAKAYGSVDMNSFKNGVVFFVFGEDEDQIEDIEDDYDSYSDIDEDDDDLQKVKVYNDLDQDGDFVLNMKDLTEDTKYYYAIGVAYEDDDDDDVIKLGSVKSFTTDDESGDNDDDDDDGDEPEVDTGTVKNINDDSADAFGEVDMNDFENGLVFFVFGEDRSLIEDVEDEYDTFADIDEDGNDLQKVKVFSGLDSDGEFELNMDDLDSNTTIYYAIGVEYEDDDNDDVLKLGSIRSFTTD